MHGSTTSLKITHCRKFFARYKREMEQIIAMQADLDKKLDRQVDRKFLLDLSS